MKFFSDIFNRPETKPPKSRAEREVDAPLLKLEPEFTYDIVRDWFANSLFRRSEEKVQEKTRFFFDESDIPVVARSQFMTKVAWNVEPQVPHKFVGFTYCSKERRGAMAEWVKNFPWAEAIRNVGTDGLPNNKTTREQLKGDPIEES